MVFVFKLSAFEGQNGTVSSILLPVPFVTVNVKTKLKSNTSSNTTNNLVLGLV